MKPTYIKNDETGVIHLYDEYMITLPHMVPCNEDGSAFDGSACPKAVKAAKLQAAMEKKRAAEVAKAE